MASREAYPVAEALPKATGGVVVDNLSVAFGNQTVLQKVHFRVGMGETLTLLGNSGCGKTTLLRAIAGFIRPSAGRIWIGGRDVTHLPPHRRGIGFVHQQYALFPHLSVEQNIRFGLREHKVPSAQARVKCDAALKLVHMTAARGLFPSELSGGMQQRVALARCLVLQPPVLLLDEPLSALDANLRVALRRELKAMRERFPQMTMIYVTHDREEAMTFSDRIAVLKDGMIEQMGTPSELYDQPQSEFVARFLGELNALPEALAKRVAAERKLVGSPGKWYLRPERIVLTGERQIVGSGVVSATEWLGGSHRIEVALDDDARSLLAVTTLRLQAEVQPGQKVSLSFNPEDCLYVPRG